MTQQAYKPATGERIACEVCGRRLLPLKDGTARNHVPRSGAEDYCGGSRHRLARWPVGQRLRHHAGSVWEVVEDGGPGYDYLLRCIVGTPGEYGEAVGKTMVTRGEYMHRDGWKPLPPDLMAALEASLKAATDGPRG